MVLLLQHRLLYSPRQITTVHCKACTQEQIHLIAGVHQVLKCTTNEYVNLNLCNFNLNFVSLLRTFPQFMKLMLTQN